MTMNEMNIILDDTTDSIQRDKKNFFQVDFLKTFMIGLVIIDHAFGYTSHQGLGFELWERIAIPVFLIIMGFNMGNSFAKKGNNSLKELYSWNYFKSKLWRFVFPYFVFYIVSTSIGFIIYGANFPDTFSENWFLDYIVFQKSLLEGPGNWFIPIIFQSIILLPLMYKSFSKWPIASLILCFIIEICFHVFLFFLNGQLLTIEDWQREFYFRYIIFLYISAIGMGFWFSRDHNLFSRKNWFVWILFPISLIYQIAWDFFGFRLGTETGTGIVRGDYNYLTFIYSALIFLIILKIIPQNPKYKILKVFTTIGRSTFHIYLVQDIFYIILYIKFNSLWTTPGFSGIVNVFGIVANDILTTIGLLIINWVLCISCGVMWWYAEKRFRMFVLNRKN